VQVRAKSISFRYETTADVYLIGPAGLAAIKSLLDEGFEVTCFEQRANPGGIWAFSEDPTHTSVTSQTKAQLSKFLVRHCSSSIYLPYAN
jgi:dimethylaniline monooxygenase (N-oxide forming)